MTQEQKEDFKSGFEIAYQLEDFEGVCEWVMNFIEIDIESKLRQDAVSEQLIKMPCSFSGVMSENCTKCGMPEYMHVL